jgi:hypothetical protein
VRGSLSRVVRVALLLVVVLGLLYAGTYLRGRKLPPPELVALPVPSSEIEVQVLNQSGASQGKGGLPRGAQRVARLLREKGFDVVELGNGSQVGLETTEVVVRGDDMEKGAKVAQAINCQLVRSEAAPDLLVDVTVLVGKDIERLVALPD